MDNNLADSFPTSSPKGIDIGVVLSGGGSRGAYQVGALKALIPVIESSSDVVSVVIGTSMGAVNAILLAGCLRNGLSQAVHELEMVWKESTFRNTFGGSPSLAFLRALKLAILKYSCPHPGASKASIFDPTPLMNRIDGTLKKYGGLSLSARDPKLKTVAVMTTIEGKERKPLLFASSHHRLDQETLKGAAYDICYVDMLTSRHGLASAALPSVLPAVDLDVEGGTVTLVDGGICENVPVDPAIRFGAHHAVIIDSSGRAWWHDRYGISHDTRPLWEVPSADQTYCLRPPETFVVRNQTALGPLLKHAVSHSTSRFIKALGPTWPIFTLLRRKMGDELAYEVMTYVAVDRDFTEATIEMGYRDTLALLEKRKGLTFKVELDALAPSI